MSKDALYLVTGGQDPLAMHYILAARVTLPYDFDLKNNFDEAVERLINLIKADAGGLKETVCQANQ